MHEVPYHWTPGQEVVRVQASERERWTFSVRHGDMDEKDNQSNAVQAT